MKRSWLDSLQEPDPPHLNGASQLEPHDGSHRLLFTDETLIRAEEFEALKTADRPVAILDGRSGSGKSYLLNRACSDPGSGWSSLGEIRRSDTPGFLLQSRLGDALAAGIEGQRDLERLSTRMRRALTVVGVGLPREALQIGLGRVLAAVTAGVAPDLKAGVAALRESLYAEMPEGLAERIEEAGGVSALDTFLDLAAQVRAFGNGVPLTICLDRAERLNADAVDLLRDFAEDASSGGVRILVAVRGDTPDGEDVLARLGRSAPSVSRIAVPPLTASRLTAAIPGLRPAIAQELVERHEGSMLRIVDDLRRAVARQRPLVPGSSDAAQSLDQLDSLTARAAESLAVFPERPDERTLSMMLGLGPAAVQAVERELTESGLFEVNAEGVGWFHELRRAALLERLGDRRPQLARRALLSLEEELRSSDEMLGAAVELAELAAPGLEGDARAMWEVDEDGLGLVAAHLELSVPGRSALGMASLGRYAKEHWFTQNATAGAAALVDAGLMSEEENQAGVPLLARTEWSAVSIALARGRLLRDRGRAPVPYLAHMLLGHGLGDRLGGAEYRGRIGPTSVAKLAELEAELRDGRESAATLMVDADFRGVPLGIAARFESEAERDRMIPGLSGLVRSVFGKSLIVGFARPGPIGAQAACRWSVVVDLLDVDLDSARADRGGDAHLAERLRLITQLSNRMTDAERGAAEVDEPIAVGRLSTNGLTLEVELLGGRSGPVDIGVLGPTLRADPLRALIAADELLPRAGERIGRSQVGTGSSRSPLRAAVERIEGQIAEFNTTQPPLEVDIGDDALSRLLESSVTRLYKDTIVLKTALGLEDDEEPANCDLHLIASDARTSGSKSDLDAYLVKVRREADDSPSGHLHILTTEAFKLLKLDALPELLEVEAEEISMISFSSLRGALARLMGYAEDDITLGFSAS